MLFALGALVPVIPLTLLAGRLAILGCIAASGLALAAMGVMTSLFNGRAALYSAVRQLLLGAAAAAVTYGVGTLLGAALR